MALMLTVMAGIYLISQLSGRLLVAIVDLYPNAIILGAYPRMLITINSGIHFFVYLRYN
jgi:hypothetical protein